MELLTATVSVPVWTLLLFGGICIADMVIRDRHTRMAIDTANKAVLSAKEIIERLSRV